jgi:hypothetical protein
MPSVTAAAASIPPSWQVEAEFAGLHDCWRYLLTHRCEPGPLVLFAMMNPSGRLSATSES